MKRYLPALMVLVFLASACSQGTPVPTLVPAIPTSTLLPLTVAPTQTSSPITPTLAPDGAFMKGITLNNFGARLDSANAKDVIQEHILPSGANYVALIPTCWTKDWNSTDVFCLDQNVSGLLPPMPDDELINAIRYLHGQGLRVLLKPQMLPEAEVLQSRNQVVGRYWNESQWQAFFASYTAYITHYARIAEDNHVDLFTVGSEQNDTTYREADWRQVIAAVRAIYHGKLTYASNSFNFEAGHIKFWDALDYIGINGYYGMADKSEPSVADMEAAWVPMLQQMQDLSKQWDKPIIISEVGARSVKNFTLLWLKGQQDWINDAYDGQLQANYYTAMFESLKNQSWLKGIFIWDVYTDPSQAGFNDTAYTFIGKPAEPILDRYFGGQVIIPTPTPNLVEDSGNSMGVYSNGQLLNQWTEYIDPGTKVPPDLLSSNGHIDSHSIDLPLSKVNMIEFDHDPPIDTTQYAWLEFYVMVGKNEPKPLQAFLGYWTQANPITSRIAFVDNPIYIEGSRFQPSAWQRVRIPIADFNIGPLFNELRIFTCPWSCQLNPTVNDVYIDDIRLVGGKAP